MSEPLHKIEYGSTVCPACKGVGLVERYIKREFIFLAVPSHRKWNEWCVRCTGKGTVPCQMIGGEIHYV